MSVTLTWVGRTEDNWLELKDYVKCDGSEDVSRMKEWLKGLHYPFSESKQKGFRNTIDSLERFFVPFKPEGGGDFVIYGATGPYGWSHLCRIVLYGPWKRL